jgi:hypothetical protein
MSLSEAKRCVDALLGNKMPEIPHLSQEQAEALLDSVNNLGVVARIDCEAREITMEK